MNIRSVIISHGKSFNDISKAMGVRPSTLAGMLEGNPTIKTLRAIAKNVPCEVGEFFIDELPADFDLAAARAAMEGGQEADHQPEPMPLLAPGQCACPRCGAAITFTAFALAVEQPEDEKKEAEHEQV